MKKRLFYSLIKLSFFFSCLAQCHFKLNAYRVYETTLRSCKEILNLHNHSTLNLIKSMHSCANYIDTEGTKQKKVASLKFPKEPCSDYNANRIIHHSSLPQTR